MRSAQGKKLYAAPCAWSQGAGAAAGTPAAVVAGTATATAAGAGAGAGATARPSADRGALASARPPAETAGPRPAPRAGLLALAPEPRPDGVRPAAFAVPFAPALSMATPKPGGEPAGRDPGLAGDPARFVRAGEAARLTGGRESEPMPSSWLPLSTAIMRSLARSVSPVAKLVLTK